MARTLGISDHVARASTDPRFSDSSVKTRHRKRLVQKKKRVRVSRDEPEALEEYNRLEFGLQTGSQQQRKKSILRRVCIESLRFHRACTRQLSQVLIPGA